MSETTTFGIENPEVGDLDPEVALFREHFEGRRLLDEVVQRGAQQMLQKAIEAEVEHIVEAIEKR